MQRHSMRSLFQGPRRTDASRQSEARKPRILGPYLTSYGKMRQFTPALRASLPLYFGTGCCRLWWVAPGYRVRAAAFAVFAPSLAELRHASTARRRTR
jgi:hypothetical protein